MTALAVNGIAVPATIESVAEQLREIGETSAAFDGSLSSSRLAMKRDLTFETSPLIAADALAWDLLFRGVGHHWSWDTSLYGSKGLGPSTVGAGVVLSTAVTPKYGASHLLIPNGISLIYTGAALGLGQSVSGGWTAMAWRYESAAWHHYLVRSDATKWKDGASNNAAGTTWLSIASTTGTLTLTGVGGSDNYLDDLVVLPYLVPTGWPASLYAAGRAFSDLRKLTLTGDLITEATTRTALGASESAKVLFGVSSTFQALRKLSVTLQEV